MRGTKMSFTEAQVGDVFYSGGVSDRQSYNRVMAIKINSNDAMLINHEDYDQALLCQPFGKKYSIRVIGHASQVLACLSDMFNA